MSRSPSVLDPLQHWLDSSGAFWRRLLRRDRVEPSPVTLDRSRIYILPTRSGFIFAVVLLAMLLGSINYNNSLGFLLTFLLASLGVTSMLHTFRNLHGLSFSCGTASPVFAGDEVSFPMQVSSQIPNPRFAINLLDESGSLTTFDLEGINRHWLRLIRKSTRRGIMPLGRVIVESRFPLGLFRAWGYLNLECSALIYPAPAGSGELPANSLIERGAEGDRGRGSDDFASLRPYHPGDSLRHIHWKALAREQGVLTKQFGGGVDEELLLSWETLAGFDVESRLSMLTRWVILSERASLSYGLQLPQLEIKPARGEEHRLAVLKALALFDAGER